jgi:hypothetical protein
MMNNAVGTVREWRGPRGLRFSHLALALLGLLVLIGATILAWWVFRPAPQWEAGTMPVSPEIEEKFGVRFSLLAVTADGGMIELRYRVIDEGKAANFGHYTETAPLLIAEDTGEMVDVTIMGLHNHRVEPGRQYYVLYRNTGGAIGSGRPVTIALGDLKLEHVVAW